MSNPRNRALLAAVEEFGIHGALHALVEVCYRKAADLDRSVPVLSARRAEHWRAIAKRLTVVEAEAAKLDI